MFAYDATSSGAGCPLPEHLPPVDLCAVADCNDLDLSWTWQVNPESRQTVVFRHVIWRGASLYLERTPVERAEDVATLLRLVKGGGTATMLLREHESGRVVSEWEAIRWVPSSTFDAGPKRGAAPLIRLTPPRLPGAGVVDAVWFAGAPGTPTSDVDHDGVPDLVDNCLVVGNGPQPDRDGDGFGDECDADLDNDGSVTRRDLGRVSRCLGATAPPNRGPEEPLPRWLEDRPAWWACAAADLDDSGAVDNADLTRMRAARGGVPGPSRRVRSEESRSGGE